MKFISRDSTDFTVLDTENTGTKVIRLESDTISIAYSTYELFKFIFKKYALNLFK